MKEQQPLLNEPQQHAVECKEGPLLVLAGAGSGKTRVVTYKIVELIHSGVAPTQILGLTFTNKAADEMKQRVCGLTDCHVLISTFHSLGARILRESIHHLGYRNDFSIYDEEDAEKLLRSCLNTTLLKKGDIKAIRSHISKCKNEMVTPDEVDTSSLTEQAEKQFYNAYSMYQCALKDAGALDFDDLLYLVVKLFVDFPAVLQMYQDRWHYLLIDEYQDTNAAQYEMIKMLAEKRKNICVVGDPDQSIYSWRGATVGNILNFEKDYPNANVVTLSQNYRSTENILDAANELIRNNTSSHQYEKSLWSELGEGEKIQHFAATNEKEEAAYVVDQIRYHMKNGISLNDMVIFYRTNFQSRVFEDALLFDGIPYTIVGGLSYYHRREVKDILAFLRMSQVDTDIIAFSRTINLPKRGIGATTIDKLRQAAISEGVGILEICRNHEGNVKLSAKQKTGLKDYLEVISSLKEVASKGDIADVVRAAIYQSGYLTVLKQDPETFEDRKENIDELISKAAQWQASSEGGTLSDFLAELALKSTLDETQQMDETVKLMTLHNGKGLEFEITFLVGMEEDLFPHINSKNAPDTLEEERRLCYVGITRARQLLYISHARYRYMWGMERMMTRSRFIGEIPSRYIEKV